MRLTRSRRFASVLAATAALALALAPALAEARVGGRSSMGSRGARTYVAPPPTQTAPGTVRPMDRTMTEPARPGAPAAGAQFGRPAVPATGGFFSRSPFMAGLMGGLIGVGLGGLLFGNGLFGGISGFAGFLGLLLQIALIAGLVWLVLRLVRGPRPVLAGGPSGMARGMERDLRARPAMGGGHGGAAPARSAPIQVGPGDFETFERLLKQVNEAWTRRDLAALRSMATPEMVRFFEDDYAALDARGWRNEAHDVKLEQGDLAEAWREDGQEFATVALRFSLIDVTRRVSDGAVVEGDPNQREMATEIWTFVRRPGTDWTLSAIQQTR